MSDEITTDDQIASKDNYDENLFKLIGTCLVAYRGGSDEEVTVPYGVTEIKNSAFRYGSKNIKRLNLPSTLTAINGAALDGCDNLEELRIPPSVKRIDQPLREFASLKLTEYGGASYLADEDYPFRVLVRINPGESLVNMHPDTEVICGLAFSEHYYRLTVNFSEKITAIPDGAFSNCLGIGEIYLPDSVREIGGGAFARCRNLRTLSLPDGLLSFEESSRELIDLGSWDGDFCFLPSRGNPKAVLLACRMKDREIIRVPDGTEIVTPWSLFLHRTRHTAPHSVVLPPSVRYMCRDALDSIFCHDVFLPSDIRIADVHGCVSSPEEMNYAIAKGGNLGIPLHCYDREQGLPDFYIDSAGRLLLYSGPGGRVTVPDSVTEIQRYAFAYRDDVTEIKLPDGLTEIGARAFKRCSALRGRLNIPPSVKNIGEYAFQGCRRLGRISLSRKTYLWRNAMKGICPLKIRKY